MSQEINFEKMNNELIQIYDEFIKEPDNNKIIGRIISYSKKFGGLSDYNDLLSKKPIPENLNNALKNLSSLYQYGSYCCVA